MSDAVRSLRVTPRALADLQAISRYTETKWGQKQRKRYLAKLVASFDFLAAHPLTGKNRPEVAPGYFSYPVGSHVVFYRITPDYLDILGVVHKAMDVDGI